MFCKGNPCKISVQNFDPFFRVAFCRMNVASCRIQAPGVA
jgi:uncharacterized membrane protein